METKTNDYKGLEKAIRDCTILSIKNNDSYHVKRYSLFSFTTGKFNISDYSLIGGAAGTKDSSYQLLSFGNYGKTMAEAEAVVGSGNFGNFDKATTGIGFGNFGDIDLAITGMGLGNFGNIQEAVSVIGVGNFGNMDSANTFFGLGNFGKMNEAMSLIGFGNFGRSQLDEQSWDLSGDYFEWSETVTNVVGLGNFGKFNKAEQYFGLGNFGKFGNAISYVGLGNFGVAGSQKSYLSIGNFGKAEKQTGGLMSVSKNPEIQKSLINIAYGNNKTKQFGLINYSGTEGITFGRNKAYLSDKMATEASQRPILKESKWKFNWYDHA